MRFGPFPSGLRRMNRICWARISAVTKIAYGAGSVTYSTFDADSTDVLRLDFVPDFVTVGGKNH